MLVGALVCSVKPASLGFYDLDLRVVGTHLLEPA
jgi:hypothetical protein